MKKKDEISEALYMRLRQTGAQPARLYGLAKVHKQGTPRALFQFPPFDFCCNPINKSLIKMTFDVINCIKTCQREQVNKFLQHF